MDDGQPYAPNGFPVGTEIAGYQIEEQVGRGGMAVVYRATDVRLQRVVALKVLAPDLARDAAFRERFIREMRAAAAVDHPHIVPVFDAGEANGALYIAMLYASGHDVRTLIAAAGPLAAPRVADIVSQVASALDAAHSHDLIHRDVKPGNMLLASVPGNGQPDHVYLSDFGLSKQSFSSASLTLTGQFLGTIDYMAPEQVEGSPIDGRADLYGLACAAYEMFTGAPPFKRDQNFAAIWAQLSAPAPSLARQRPDLSPAVDQVLAKALAKSPDDRYPTCGEFAAALRAACGQSAGAMPGPLPGPAFGPGRGQGQGPARGEPHGPPRNPAHGPPPELGAAIGPAFGPADLGGRRPTGPASPPAPAAWPGSVPQRRPAAAQSSEPEPPTVRLGEIGPPAHSGAGPTMPMPSAGPAPTWRMPPQRPALTAGPSGPADSLARPPQTWQGAPPPPPPRMPYREVRGSRSRPRGAAIAGGVAGCVLMLAVAGVLFVMLRGRGSTPPPPAHKSAHHSQPAVVGPAGPADTVQAYFNAINDHDYQRAWTLGGKNTGVSYTNFVQGFNQTASDDLTIVSVNGDIVNVQLDATQTNGTVKHFHGSYTVSDGVITVSRIQAGV